MILWLTKDRVYASVNFVCCGNVSKEAQNVLDPAELNVQNSNTYKDTNRQKSNVFLSSLANLVDFVIQLVLES